MKLADVLQRKTGGAVTVTLEATAADAIRHMYERGVGSVVITSSDGRPLGIFTERDILSRVVAAGIEALRGLAAATALLARNVDFSHLGGGFDVSMGFVSGVLNTSVGTNGPPRLEKYICPGIMPSR